MSSSSYKYKNKLICCNYFKMFKPYRRKTSPKERNAKKYNDTTIKSLIILSLFRCNLVFYGNIVMTLSVIHVSVACNIDISLFGEAF